MADIKRAFGTGGTFTITLNSMTHSLTAGRASTYLDLTTDLPLDVLVFIKWKTGSGTQAVDKGVHVYAYAYDGNANYSDGITGSDANFTMTDPPNLVYLGFISTPASATTYYSRPFSMAQAFGGNLPKRVGIFVRNATNITSDSTAGNFEARYQLVYATAV